MIAAPTAGCQTPTFHCLLLPVWNLSLWRLKLQLAGPLLLWCRVLKPHTWRTCVYLPARAVHTKRLNKVADAVRRLEIHA